MPPDYPNDSDGDALRRVASHGSDMNRSMLIDFPVVISSESAAKQFARVAAEHGFKVHLWKHHDDSDWDVICAIEMVPTYNDVVRIQNELAELSVPFSGCCNCWGTFGNKAEAQPKAG